MACRTETGTGTQQDAIVTIQTIGDTKSDSTRIAINERTSSGNRRSRSLLKTDVPHLTDTASRRETAPGALDAWSPSARRRALQRIGKGGPAA